MPAPTMAMDRLPLESSGRRLRSHATDKRGPGYVGLMEAGGVALCSVMMGDDNSWELPRSVAGWWMVRQLAGVDTRQTSS